jgi:hypothetical protein
MKTLSFEQMEVINAGWPDWLVNAWNSVCNFFDDVWTWITGEAWYWIQECLEFEIDSDGYLCLSFGVEW